MTKLHVTWRDGSEAEIEATDGRSVMEGIRDTGSEEIMALCGGSCSCATCHIHVAPDWIERTGRAEGVEAELLSTSDHCTDTSRLSCQIAVTPALAGLRLSIAPED